MLGVGTDENLKRDPNNGKRIALALVGYLRRAMDELQLCNEPKRNGMHKGRRNIPPQT